MHEKYGKDGFQVISVATDPAGDTKALTSARAFLRDKLKAKFPSVHVDAATFDYDRKISTAGVPAAFVFNRENRWVGRWPRFSADGKTIEEDLEYDAIEKVVAAEIEKKGDK